MRLKNHFTIQEIYLKLDLIVIKTLKLEMSKALRLFQLDIGAYNCLGVFHLLNSIF